MKPGRLSAAMLAAILAAAPADAATCDDPFVGVWQLDLASSEFTLGADVKSKRLIFSQVAGGMLISEEVVTAEGETVVYRIPFTYDGASVPQDANPAYDALAVERIDPRTLRSTLRRKGAVVGKASQTITPDGRTMRFTSELTLPTGQQSRQSSIFRKL